MSHRLLLGAGGLVASVAQSLHEQPGSLQVVTADTGLADSLRDQGIGVEALEQIDASALSTVDRPEIVGVFDEDPRRTRTLSDIARSVYPDAEIVAYAGWESGADTPAKISTPADSRPLEVVADQVVDPAEAVASHVIDRIGNKGQRMRQLQGILRDIDNLAVVTHDNPDPDALGSAFALARIARRAGCTATVCYYGEITHQENRAFVNVLNMELRNLEPDENLAEFDGLALVDHSRAGVNDGLPPDSSVDIVIDHHPPRSPVDARFVDLRSNVGATSTLLVDYLDRFNIPLEEDIATALLFGIHVDTDGFSREISREDFLAGARLVETANFGMLERIESPSISPQTFETIADAISNRELTGAALLSCVGELAERDALAQAADRLLNMEGVSTVLVYGIKDGEIFISARARGADIDLGETLREAFGQIGSAGGHVDMAGAQIELGVLESIEDRDESLRTIVEDIVSSRFLDELETGAGAPLQSRYLTEAELDAEYLGEEATDTPPEAYPEDDRERKRGDETPEQ